MAAASNASGGGTAITSVGNSALYNLADNENLTRNDVAGTSNQKQYLSWWLYRGVLNSALQAVFHCDDGTDSNREYMIFNTDNTIQWVSITGGSTKLALHTSRVFRDIGWYHIELLFDTTQAVASNRNIMRVNGERITEFTTETNFDLNQTFGSMGSVGDTFRLGAYRTTSYGYDGYMAECVRIDGDPAGISTGEYDSTGLYWTPKSSTVIEALTFGNNGFYLPNEADLSSNMTTFVDSGPTAHTITTGNNTTHSPLGHKVQNSVIYADGTTDYISVAPSGHADFTFGTGDFCIEGWFNRIALSGTSSYSYIFDFRYSGGNTLRPACYMTNLNTLVYAVGSGTGITASTNAVVGTWFNVAIARSGSTTTMYLNGTSVGSFTDNTDYASGRPWFFEYPQSNAYGFKGYATELRISKGVPRHTGNFTPSTTAFVSDSNTSLLVHSDKFFGVGNDESGKYNSFNNNNSVTKSTHTPTNLNALLNPLGIPPSTAILSNGNTNITNSGSDWKVVPATLGIYSGKYYWEVEATGSGSYSMIGIATAGSTGFPLAVSATAAGAYQLLLDGYKYSAAGGRESYTSSWAAGDRMGVAFDADNGFVYISKDGTWMASSDPTSGASGTNAMFGSLTDLPYYPASNVFSGYSQQYYLNEADWSASAPTGYIALNTTTLAAATTRTASDTNKYFQTTLYEGNGAGQRVGAFQPFDNTFTVAKSGLSIRASSQYLSRTPSSTGNTQKGTFSTWLKRGIPVAGGYDYIFTARISNTQMFNIYFTNLNALHVSNYSSGYDWRLIPTQVYTDTSQWMHICVAVDTTLGTAADRAILYVNGVRETVFSTETQPSLNFANDFNTASVPNYIGAFSGSAGVEYDGYQAEVVWIDGTQYAASDFGQTDTSTNRWIPKDVSGLTFGTNGFYLNYAASGDIGNDVSGNNNDFTNNNGVVQSTDSPTTNLAVLDSNFTNATLSNGNRTSDAGSGNCTTRVTIPMTTGKFYWEGGADAQDSTNATPRMGIGNLEQAKNVDMGNAAQTTWAYNMSTNSTYYGKTIFNATQTGSAVSFTTSQVAQFAYDADAGKFWVGKDNTWLFSGNPATGANPTYEGIVGPIFPCVQDTGTSKSTIAIAEADWTYSAPTDFVALAQDNLAGTDQFISAFSWIKNRDATDNHMLFDRVRGATNYLQSSANIVNTVNVNTVQSFLEAGVQVGNDVQVNTASESYVLWNFMTEATGSGTSNASGDITTTCLVDTTLGMSVGTYTGSGVSGNTVGTGLDDCKIFIVKRMSNATNWPVTFPDILTDDYQVYLDSTGAQGAGGFFDTSANTGGQIGLTNHYSSNASSQPYFFLAFNSSQFISIGSFEGNGNANGAFAPMLNSLGIPIQPVFFFSKNIDATNNWDVRDIIRSPYNPSTNNLQPSTSSAEVNGTDYVDIVTGGLKLRTSSANLNGSAKTIAYVAIGTPIIDTDGRIIAGR